MTDTPNRTSEIAAYMVAVERHLSDLPERIRNDLMSELDTHLSEVAADLEPGASLRDLLGSPESYARELRETAEVEKEPARTRMRRRLAEAAAPALARLRTGADKYAASTGHADAAELAERLRPGWWVLRGALAGLLVVYMLAASQFNATGYLWPSTLPWALFTIVSVLFFAWVSLRVGARSQGWSRRRRQWTAAVGVGLVVYAFYGFGWPFAWMLGSNDVIQSASIDEGYYYDDMSGVDDVYVYDEDGNLVTGVYLFDQNGDPLLIGDPYACPIGAADPFAPASPDEFDAYEEEIERGDEHLGYQYPLCVPSEADATESPAPEASPTETPSETPTADATPTPGEKPTTAPSESPSAAATE